MTIFSIFNRTFILARNLATSSERLKNIYPKKAYQFLKTLFDKLDSFGLKCASEQKLIKKLAIIVFESIRVQEDTYKDRNTKAWIKKHVPLSVSISWNLVEQPNFLCNSDPHHLVPIFLTPENFFPKANQKWKTCSLIFRQQWKINRQHVGGNHPKSQSTGQMRRFDKNQKGCEKKCRASTQFL